MCTTIKAISYEEYVNTPSLRNSYNDTLVKCHLYNYGCIFVETILGVTDVMEIEEVEEAIRGKDSNFSAFVVEAVRVALLDLKEEENFTDSI